MKWSAQSWLGTVSLGSQKNLRLEFVHRVAISEDKRDRAISLPPVKLTPSFRAAARTVACTDGATLEFPLAMREPRSADFCQPGHFGVVVAILWIEVPGPNPIPACELRRRENESPDPREHSASRSPRAVTAERKTGHQFTDRDLPLLLDEFKYLAPALLG